MKNTRVSSIVCFTILVLPVVLGEEYWGFRYCVYFTILVLPVLLAYYESLEQAHTLD
jgi:hypothetical protein